VCCIVAVIRATPASRWDLESKPSACTIHTSLVSRIAVPIEYGMGIQASSGFPSMEWCKLKAVLETSRLILKFGGLKIGTFNTGCTDFNLRRYNIDAVLRLPPTSVAAA
jgi:hypothetical protein